MNILVTGTSSGFGRLTAESLARAGHTVFATMRDTAGRNAAAAQALAAIPNVHVLEMDVTSDASVDTAMAAIAARGPLHGVVNNAGRFSMGVQEAFTLDEVKSLFETNVFGVLRVNRAALPHLRKQRGGAIVNLSSIVGRFSLPTLGTYAATKFAVEALAEAQRDELKGLGIDVTLVQPGAFPTEVGNNGLYAADAARAEAYGPVAQIPQKMGEGLAQLFGSPMAPKPQDVADAIVEIFATPAGQRPARVLVDALTGGPVRALNEHHEKLRHEMMASFGLA
jgi:NAD(P)-dependent dehydrogenase (short-subunit alcohol dehydrogenase family)